jgi:hippurate hydrolase
MNIIPAIQTLQSEAAAWRQDLHQNPQTCYEEIYASQFVKKKLKEWGIPYRDNYAVTGIVGTIEGRQNTSGKALALRADMDALDILEKTDLPYASKNAGKMHGCGHDGHTACLLAAAKYLNDTKNFNGKVHLIFQPAEEGGRGAVRMMEEGLFKDFPCDYIFGIHNWPDLDLGKADMRSGAMLASVDDFEITVIGKGGHAAYPHQTIDPLIAATNIVNALQTIISRNTDPIQSGVVTVASIQSQSNAFNVIDDTVSLNGTVRTFDNDLRKLIKQKIEAITTSIAQGFGCSVQIKYEHQLDPVINSEQGIIMSQQAASSVLGAENINTDCDLCMGGEDFGAYLTEVPGAFVFIGQAEPDTPSSFHNNGLHNPQYDFNDKLIPIVASYYATLCETYLQPEK